MKARLCARLSQFSGDFRFEVACLGLEAVIAKTTVRELKMRLRQMS